MCVRPPAPHLPPPALPLPQVREWQAELASLRDCGLLPPAEDPEAAEAAAAAAAAAAAGGSGEGAEGGRSGAGAVSDLSNILPAADECGCETCRRERLGRMGECRDFGGHGSDGVVVVLGKYRERGAPCVFRTLVMRSFRGVSPR